MAIERPTECPLCNLVLTYENFGVRACECGYESYADGTTNTTEGGKVEEENGGDTEIDSPSKGPEEAIKESKETEQSVKKSSGVRRDLNYIAPGMRMLPQVTVVAWYTGPIRGFRYGIVCPYGPDGIKWSKTMTGIDAFQFLRGIQSANRTNRVESRELPAADDSE